MCPFIRCCFLTVASLIPFNLAYAQNQIAAYYKIRGIHVRGLSIEGIAVKTATFGDPSSATPDSDVTLRLTATVVTIECGAAAEFCLSGAISDESAGSVIARGKFTWDKGGIEGVQLTKFQFRAQSVTLRFPVFGGTLQTDPTLSTTVQNKDTLTFSPTGLGGTLAFIIPHAQLTTPHVEIANLKFTIPLMKSAGTTKIELNIGDGNATLDAGTFTADKAVSKVDSPVTQLFGKTVLQGGNVELDGLRFSVQPPSAKITSLNVSNPVLNHSGLPNVPIVSATVLQASALQGAPTFGSDGIRISNPSVTAWVVQSDAFQIIDRLNQHWIQDPDVLLPTADPTIHFVTLSALDTLYRQLAKSAADTNDIYRIYLHKTTDVVNSVTTEVIAAKPQLISTSAIPRKTSSGQQTSTSQASIEHTTAGGQPSTPKVCLIFDGDMSTTVAGIATTYLLGMVVPGSMRLSVSYAAALTVATLLAPDFGAPVFLAVYGTTYLLQTYAGTKLANYLTSEGKHYCEVLLGEGKPGKAVVLPDPHDDPSQNYEQQMRARYDGYVSARKQAGLGMAPNVPTRAYSVLQDNFAARAQYNSVVALRNTAWDSKRQEDLKQLAQAETSYQQTMAQTAAQTRALNAQTGTNVINQLRADEEQRRAIANTPIVTTPVSQSQAPTIKTYIIVQPQ